MHSKSNNIEIMVNDKLEDVIKELFQSLLSRYQIGMKTSMRVSDFIFDCVHLLYYKCDEISFNQGGSYIDSPDWIKIKKLTINPINKKDNKCFKYAVTVALNHEETRKDLQRITKIKPFIDEYNYEGINYPSEKDDWKKFE